MVLAWSFGESEKSSFSPVAASMPTYLIFIVASLPLRHSCGIMLLAKQYETNLSRLRPRCCLESSSPRTTCGIIANFILKRLNCSFIKQLWLACRLILKDYSTAHSLSSCGFHAELTFIVLFIIEQFCGLHAGLYYTAHH